MESINFFVLCEQAFIEEASKQNLIFISQQAKRLRDKFKTTSNSEAKKQILVQLHDLRTQLAQETEIESSEQLNHFITKAYQNPLFQNLMVLHTKIIGAEAPVLADTSSSTFNQEFAFA